MKITLLSDKDIGIAIVLLDSKVAPKKTRIPSSAQQQAAKANEKMM